MSYIAHIFQACAYTARKFLAEGTLLALGTRAESAFALSNAFPPGNWYDKNQNIQGCRVSETHSGVNKMYGIIYREMMV